MLSFFQYLIEKKKTASDEESFKAGDTAGKIFEILKGRFHNGGREFPDSYRVEGKRPEEIHNALAEKQFGSRFEKHPIYKNMSQASDTSAELTERFLAGKHHHDREKGFNRVAWTSQESDPEKFLGFKPEKTVADNMVELHHGAPHGLSEKVTQVGSSVNYSNPGVNTFENSSGMKLTQHNDDHKEVIKKISGQIPTDENTERYVKRITREKNPENLTPVERRHRAQVLDSYSRRNKNYGTDMRNAYETMSAADKKDGGSRLRDAVRSLVVPSSEHPTTVTHTELNDDGSHNRTRVYDLHEHIDQYLDNFHQFHIQRNEKEPATVTIHAVHKKTGATMPVARIAIYGEKHVPSPRGSVVLPSENHQSVHYHGELDTAGEHGDTFEKHSLDSSVQRPTAKVRVSQSDFPDEPKSKKSKKVTAPVTPAPQPQPAAQQTPQPRPQRNPSTRFSTIKAASGDWRANQTHSQNLAGSMSHGSNFYSDSDRAEFSKGFN
jgi:hypothetical protein